MEFHILIQFKQCSLMQKKRLLLQRPPILHKRCYKAIHRRLHLGSEDSPSGLPYLLQSHANARNVGNQRRTPHPDEDRAQRRTLAPNRLRDLP
jgi:hypothetical protein